MSRFVSSREPVRLDSIWPPAAGTAAGAVVVRGCTCDSRACQPGDLFVALDGTDNDGHDFAQEAARRGAAAVIAERPLGLDLPECLVTDARSALAEVCHSMAGHPAGRLRCIGITGTNGKTTTAQLVASVLAAGGRRSGLVGTLGYDDSVDIEPADLTTPPAPTLARLLAQMVGHGCTHAVLEISSHAIAQRRTAGIELAYACLTNLQRDHLDYHPTLADYHHTKSQLFSALAPSGLAVVNADDGPSLAAAPLLPGRVLTVGLDEPGDIQARLIERSKSEQTFLLTYGPLAAPVRTAMIGDHHIRNCLMAAAVGLSEGMDLATVVAGLESVRQVPGRLERIECGQPFGAFVDFAHTPDALSTALGTLRQVTPGRLICVFGAGGNRDARKRPLMGSAVEAQADLAIVTTDNPRFEDPLSIASQIIAGFQHPHAARWVPDRAAAIRYALSLAGPDDVVLVAGRGHESHQTVGRSRLPLDDRAVVRDYLYNLPPAAMCGRLAIVGTS